MLALRSTWLSAAAVLQVLLLLAVPVAWTVTGWTGLSLLALMALLVASAFLRARSAGERWLAIAALLLVITSLFPQASTSATGATRNVRERPDFIAVVKEHAIGSTVNSDLIIELARISWDDGHLAGLAELKRLVAQTGMVHPERHILAHLVGKVVYLRGDEPAQAYAICFQDPTDGCMHAIAQSELEQYDKITPEVTADICDFSYQNALNGRGADTCWHAFAHLMHGTYKMGMQEMLSLCEVVRKPDGRHWCRDGVFELSFSNGPAAEKAGTIRRNEPLYPCTMLEEPNVRVCYQKIPLGLLHFYDKDVVRSGQTCEKVPTEYRKYCYYGIGQNTILLSTTDAGLPARIKLCELTGPGRDDCIRGAFNQGTLTKEEIIAACETMAPRPRQECLQPQFDWQNLTTR